MSDDTIRLALPKGSLQKDTTRFLAGGGIVADSTPEGEYNESHHKMRGPLRAIELAEDLERSERLHGGQS